MANRRRVAPDRTAMIDPLTLSAAIRYPGLHDSPRSALGSVSVKGVRLEPSDDLMIRRQKMARIILDSMYQFLGLLDVDGTVLEINRAALDGGGISLENVVGRPFWEARWWAVSPEVRERVKAMIAEARSGKFVRCDFEVYGEMGGFKTIFIDFSLTPILDDAGRVVYLLPEGRNITEKVAMSAELSRTNGELRNALEKLREIDGFKTRFFANVSHELRTPLALILGPVEQLLRECSEQEGRDRERFRLAAIKRNAQSLLHQVNDLLDLARIDSGRMPLAYVATDVPVMAQEIAASFAAMAEARGIVLSVQGAASLVAEVDASKFSRVLANLLSNAFKFTPDGGRITCLLERLANARLLLSVRDNGSGVPEPLKQHIFDRFTQGGPGLEEAGSGLGLNIVREFVELHGGTVVVVDTPGGGATFQVEIPLRAPQGAFVREARGPRDPAAPEPAGRVIRGSGPGLGIETGFGVGYGLGVADWRADLPTVLVAEDNPDLRLFLHDVLTDEYNVRLAEDGESALALALADPPDLIITDLMMPRFDGEQFVRALRRNSEFPHVPVLVLSSRADDALREKLLEELVQDYLTKPFSPQELRARVRNLVAVKRTVDILQKELNSQASDICELTTSLVDSRKSLLRSFQALQVSDRRWQGLFENTAVGIALVNREGCILSANPALQRMLGYREDEIRGVSLIERTEASQRSLTERNVHGLFDGDFPDYHSQKRYERKDGSYLWANVCASLIPAVDADGPMLAVIVEDITSRKAAEQSLLATRSELARVARFTTMGEMVASIAHEVNQPLAAVITNSNAALRWLGLDKPNYAEVVAALHRVNRDATLAGDVIARIRKFLRAGQMRREPLSLPKLVDELLLMLQGMLLDARVQVETRFLAPLPELVADGVQIQQVILNLLVNAVEAMREQPPDSRKLRIDITPAGDGGTRCAVLDAGPGVPCEAGEKLFDAFFSTKQDGLGMGLAI
ncbi:MAG: hypothetical protein RIR00_737, partial [Pseudomonadota bacterium]